MTRLAVSRALVSATTLPPLTTSCGEPTPGLAHGINSSPATPRCAIDMQRRHPTRSRQSGGKRESRRLRRDRLPLRQQRRCGYQGQLEARGAGARLQTENVSPAAGYQWAPIQWASLREHRADAARAAPQRSVAMPVRRRMSAMVGSFGGYLPNVRLPVRLCSFSSSPGPADAPRLRVTAALSGPSNSPPAQAAPANIPAASSASCGSSA